jgi:hypothetical protein
MACAVVAALFLLILVVGFARSYGELGDLLRMWQGFAELVLYPLIAIGAFSYAAISFRLRARNRGKHHVREVLDSLVATSSLEQEVAGS